MDGKDIGFFNGLRIDALMRLHMGKGREAITINRSMFEIEFRGSGLHRCRKMILHSLAFARQEGFGFAH
ncbi:hypothetical protein D3C71_2144010 [compost metagenome]